MAQQKTVSNATTVELVKDMRANTIFEHDMMSILYSETKTGAQRHDMRFAIEFKDNGLFEKDGGSDYGVIRSPGFVLAVSVHGFDLANAFLMKQKDLSSTESTGETMFNGHRLPVIKCDYSFREILCGNPEKSEEAKSERVQRLERLFSTADTLSKMYTEDLETVNATYRDSIVETIRILNRIAYSAYLAAERATEDEGQGVKALRRE